MSDNTHSACVFIKGGTLSELESNINQYITNNTGTRSAFTYVLHGDIRRLTEIAANGHDDLIHVQILVQIPK